MVHDIIMGLLISKQILLHGSVLSVWWLSRQLPRAENLEFDNIFKQVQHLGKAAVLLSQHIRENMQNYLKRAQEDFKKCKEVNWEIMMNVAREMGLCHDNGKNQPWDDSHSHWKMRMSVLITLLWSHLHCQPPARLCKPNALLTSFFLLRKNLTSWQDL